MKASSLSGLSRPFGISIALLFVGIVIIIVSAIESPLLLLGLTIHLFGLAGLYYSITLWMQRFRKPVQEVSASEKRLVGRNPGIGLIRLGSILALVIGFCLWCWGAGSDLSGLCQILMRPSVVDAQAIISPNTTPGFVNYSFRATSKLAPVGRFQVSPLDYQKYRTGRRILVTYFEGDPHIHRIGKVDFWRLLLQMIYWFLMLANGTAYLALPLWILEFRRPAPFFSLAKSTSNPK